MEPKPDRFQRFDLAGLKLAYASIAGIAAQLADIAQEDPPDDEAGAVIQHLGSSMRHLAAWVNLAEFRGDYEGLSCPCGCGRIAPAPECIAPEAPDAE